MTESNNFFEYDGYKLRLWAGRYTIDNTFACTLWTREDVYDIPEPYAEITVNLPDSYAEQMLYSSGFFRSMKHSSPAQFIDVSNYKWLPEWLEKNDIAHPVQDWKGDVITCKSGFCEYPLYVFNITRFDEDCIFDPEED